MGQMPPALPPQYELWQKERLVSVRESLETDRKKTKCRKPGVAQRHMEVIGASGGLLTSLGNQAGGGAGSKGLESNYPVSSSEGCRL